MRPRHLATAAVLAAALITGCGDQTGTGSAAPAEPADSSEPSASVTDPTEEADASGRETGPACTDVWVDGAKFPRGYKGCTAEGAYVEATWRHCASGQKLHTYGDRYYSVPGGVIGASEGPLLDDPDYRKVLATCSG